ncbi:hypothetical protein [Kribbella albertanoniae]|uniref:PH domain-containing protein n=1 Tax=Kribbella albertanoniae TaxID=1266829 RepID=A0A4R4P7E2_9ACTN|nr:hypothetical protein [Kribbella albertanoniae]TDC16082.1 hypothetical protein E1261_39605 [Kribbella albertanoniae]
MANLVMPLALVVFGLASFDLKSLLVTAPLAAWLTVRGFRLGVLLDGSEIVVRGFFWSRRIKRSAIRKIGLFPSVVWESKGHQRWTPIAAFADVGGMAPGVTARNDWAVEQMEAWAGRR